MPLVPYSPPYIAWAGTYFNLEQALSTPSLAINTSSLTVSSINGLPPGSGGGGSSSNVLVTIQANPQTIPTNIATGVELSVESDPNGWWNTSNFTFKPTVAGYYFLSAQLSFDAPIVDSNELQVAIFDNYSSVILSRTIQGGFYFNLSNKQSLTTSAVHYFDSSNTYVSMLAYNGTASNLSITTGQGYTSFQAFLIGSGGGGGGAPAPTISSFNTASISSATISSISGWSPDTLSTVVGGSSDADTLSGSLWAYSKQAETDAQIGITWITNATTPDAVGEIGTSTDIPSLSTSLWAYARYAEGASDTNLGSIQTLSTIVANLSTFNTASISSLSVSSINFNAPGTPFYNLLGPTAGAVLSNHPVGSNFPFTPLTFNLATTLTFNTPPTWQSGNSVVFDGWALYNFNATSINTFWGVAYATSSNPTPADILGSTTASNAALNYPNASQVYMPVNLIIPSTHITTGGTITLTFYVFIAIASQYFAVAPVINGRIGISLD